MFSILSSQKIIGIDLGSKVVKLVEIGKYKDSLILKNYIIIELESESRLAGLETSQIFVETLGKLLGENLRNFKTRQVIFIASAPYTFSTYFSLPHIPISSLKNAIKYEAKKYLPTSEEDFYLEWRNLEFQDIQKNMTTSWFIFLSALPLNLIEKFKRISEVAKLKYRKTDIEYFTLEGYFKNRKGINLVVNVGYSYSYAVIILDGKTVFSSKLRFSIKHIIQNLANILNVDYEEAERFYLDRGFKALPEEEDLSSLYNSLISTLIFELDKIMVFLKEVLDKNIGELYFTGGITLANYFLELFASKYQTMPIKVLNPSDFIYVDESIKNQEKLPLLTTAIGGCINFLLS